MRKLVVLAAVVAVASLESIVRSSRVTSGTSATVIFHPSSDIVPRFKPRHFGPFGQGGLVLKFGEGDFVLRFGHVPPFKHRHFGQRHHHQELFFGFDQPRRFRPWHDRGFAWP
jgi:hypothetical protein